MPENVLNARARVSENDTQNFVCVARKNAMKIFTVRTKIYVMKLGAGKQQQRCMCGILVFHLKYDAR